VSSVKKSYRDECNRRVDVSRVAAAVTVLLPRMTYVDRIHPSGRFNICSPHHYYTPFRPFTLLLDHTETSIAGGFSREGSSPLPLPLLRSHEKPTEHICIPVCSPVRYATGCRSNVNGWRLPSCSGSHGALRWSLGRRVDSNVFSPVVFCGCVSRVHVLVSELTVDIKLSIQTFCTACSLNRGIEVGHPSQ